MLPDLESLRCFETVARHRSFRRAAAEVALSPAAFGERIRLLEDRLGVRLIERTTRQVALTPAGVRLLPQARKTLAEARACVQAAVDPGQRAPWSLTVGTRFELGLSWLVPALEPLRGQRPDRTVHLRFGDSPELLRAVVDGSIDAAVTSARFTSAHLRFAPLHDEAYVLVASAELLAVRPLRTPGDVGGHTLLDASPDLPLFRYCFDALAKGTWWQFDRHEYLGTIAAIRFRVLQGAGIAVLPRYFVGEDLQLGRLVEVMPGLDLPRDVFRLIWREGHPLQDDLLQLAEDLRAFPLR